MSELLKQSWNNEEELSALAKMQRNREVVEGVVRSVGVKKMPVETNGRMETAEVEVAIFLLPGGVKAYCPANEFSDHQYSSLIGFVGTIQEFIIDRIDLEQKVAIVSVRQADEMKKDLFWEELDYLEKNEAFDSKVYEGVISGFNPEKENIFVRVNGTDCFMTRYDWDYGRIRDLASQVERGTKIQVKVQRVDRERNMIHVSRKATFEDPFDKLEELRDEGAVAGKVTEVHPIHGIFIKLDIGLEVKGMKPRDKEEPDVGDIVSCKVRTIDKAKRHCKVVIIGYPRGKKKLKNIGSFLFE
ncbi:hypothetical protein [Halobacillus litoralis]|uniref:RNA-binding protein n=1 Tax=Halobacillus litoralis TaxID=45668 RepID=A0A410MJI1_9BACI|nr:hypothetical protein [Halobacillus litoralis]QAS54815.1 RNA-binding protein [Halobacillus litoralis]